MHYVALPQVTDAHRHGAFEMLCLKGTTFDQAMKDEFHRRLIEFCASKLRTDEWMRTQRRCQVLVKRVHLDEHGKPDYWVTQRATRNYESIVQPDLLDS